MDVTASHGDPIARMLVYVVVINTYKEEAVAQCAEPRVLLPVLTQALSTYLSVCRLSYAVLLCQVYGIPPGRLILP
jgi:hypothetical protein